MKRCNTCGRDFDEAFEFCPLDASPLRCLSPRPFELKLTLLEDAYLPSRLFSELDLLVQRQQLSWARLRKNPIHVVKLLVQTTAADLRTIFRNANATAAALVSVTVVISVVMLVLQTDNYLGKPGAAPPSAPEELTLIGTLTLTEQQGQGVGKGSNGRVGFRKRAGEGSEPQPKQSRGGGGGGNHNRTQAQVGALPPPSIVPARIPVVLQKNPTLPAAGIDLDPALWNAIPAKAFGDPRSSSIVASNGPGTGGGMGNGDGTGIGSGKRAGVGPGENGNIGGGSRSPGGGGVGGSDGSDDGLDGTYKPSQVDQKLRLLQKPEPQYSEDARKNQIMGTVILRVVFTRFGEVTNIRTVHPLPFGLTEKAIAAARNIRFIPAKRNGQPVSVHMQLEYNFNLY
jgi:TonB family protein